MNLRGFLPLLPVLLLLLAVVPGSAQAPAGATYGYGYYGGGHASTAAEGALNGMSNLLSAAGSANLSNSMAAINYEAARSADLDNRLKATDTYFQIRAKNRAYREAEAGPRATSQELFRWAKEEAPSRLTSMQLDPVSGGIAWPLLLTSPEFEANRMKLDQIYIARANYHGGISQQTYQAALQLIAGMQATLKAGVTKYVPQQYVAAKKFLDSLQYELQLPAS